MIIGDIMWEKFQKLKMKYFRKRTVTYKTLLEMVLSWDFCLNSFPDEFHLSQEVMVRKYFCRGSERSTEWWQWGVRYLPCQSDCLELGKMGFSKHLDPCYYLQWLSLGWILNIFHPHQSSHARALGSVFKCVLFALSSFNVQREFHNNLC